MVFVVFLLLFLSLVHFKHKPFSSRKAQVPIQFQPWLWHIFWWVTHVFEGPSACFCPQDGDSSSSKCLCLSIRLCSITFIIKRNIRGGVDKSLARPRKKQATATKLGIYSTYYPRRSIHFLAHCCTFCKPLKKIHKVVRPTTSPRQQWPPRRMKNGDLSFVFSVQGTGGSPTGPDPENRVGDQDMGSPGRPVYCGLQVPGEPEHCRARKNPLGELPALFFLQNVLKLLQQRWVYSALIVWPFGRWSVRRIPSWSQKIEVRTFPADFCTRDFLGCGELLCCHSIDCCFYSGS